MKEIMIKNKKQEGPTKWVKQTVMMMMKTDVMIAFAVKTMNTVSVPVIFLPYVYHEA
jgi:hypothetical protein